MSTKLDFQLIPDSRLDGKWLKTDLEVALKKNNVVHYWNELLKDGELVVHGSCNSKASTPDSDTCGLGNNTGIGQFSTRKFKSDLTGVLLGHTASQKLIDSWTWNKNTDIESITECIKLLQKEQQLLCGVVAGNTISSCRLQQRVVVAYRYFLALRKHTNYQTIDHDKIWNGITNAENNLLDHTLDKVDNSPTSSSDEEQDSIYGLARIGTRTALNFAFAFLRRAWRSGEDCDICSELLLETLDALRALPEALLFKERKMSSVWIDIIEKSSLFLQQVVLCEIISTTESEIPLIDRQYALQILFELAIQRGTITAMLDMVLLLLTISEKNQNLACNRSDKDENGYPLVPFLKRFQQVLRSTFQKLNGYDIWSEKDSDDIATCPTECFLRFLEFPTDESVVIDLKIAAVIIMAYLNRLIIPYLPTAAFLDNKKLHQMVFAWGWLPWESRNKSSLCQTIGELGVIKIILSDKYLFFISFDKKLYSYNYIGDSQGVEMVSELDDKSVIDMVAHPEGRHYIALTTEGTVYSWGNGEGGRLGHGDSNSQEYPTLIKALLGHFIVRIACGSNYSAAISSQGELFTWGRGDYGRLGHGTNDDANIPLLVETLKGVKIIDVACGCGDAQTLAVTDTGLVYSWGDGDYGKLGRGGSGADSSKIPKLVESLCSVHISRVYCGAQFSVALTSDGEVFTWGKGEHYRLGHGSEEHLRFPKKVNGLKGMKVKKLAIGVTHTIALLENGDVYGWGKKEYAHRAESEATGVVPELVVNLRANNIAGVACGVTQSFAWSAPNHSKIGTRIPFISDLCKNGMNKLNKLLVTVCEGVTTISDRPPSQEKECLIVSTLNILQLQLHAISVNNVDVNEIDLNVGSPLLASIKQIVVDVASTNGVLDTIQSAAQAALQVGWSILLPTTEERAKALCSLMPAPDWNCGNLSQGQHFMTDLLVSSLMADGGLEISLQAAVKIEMSESMREDSCTNSVTSFSPIPLLQLIKQLLRNCLSQTLASLQLLKPIQVTNDRSPSLTLLIRFQRLLIAQIYQNKATESQYSWERDERNMGAESLFRKYLQHLINYVCQVLNTASEVASRSNKHFYTVCNILKNTGVEVLLPELLVSLVMLHEEVPLLLHNIDWLELFGPLFDALEQFNKITPHLEREDDDEMSWPGVSVNSSSSAYKNPEDMPFVRKADVENHNRDGGFWIIYNNKVYDIQDSDVPGEMENLRKYFKGELSVKSEDLLAPSPELLQSCCVGNYINPDEDVLQPPEISYTSSPLLDTQRTLSYLLGFHARCLSIGIPVMQTEKDMLEWLSAPYLRGGLTPLNPYEEKDEARSTNTTPTEPLGVSSCPYTSNFENPANEMKLWDTVSAFDAYLSQNFKHQSLLSFNWNHPIEEVNRMLLAVLIKHLALGPTIVECLQDGNGKNVEHFEIISNVLHKTKLKLIQMKQEQNQSYKELCVPFINKCRFLLNEVRPATSHEVNAIDRLQFLYTETMLKKTAKYVVNCIKNQKRSSDSTNKIPEKKKKEYYEEKSEDKPKKTKKPSSSNVNVKPGKPELIHAIVRFIAEERTADIELIRKAMCVQVERCSMRKQGYDLMLKLLSLTTVVASVKYNIMNGWLVTSPVLNASESLIIDSVVTPYEKMELLFSKYKILQWTLTKLQKALVQADRTFKFCASKDRNGCFSQKKLCWIRLVLSMIGLLSETTSGNELSFVINSGLFAHIEYIFRDSDVESSNKSFYGNNFNVVAIFDDEQSITRTNHASFKSASIPVTSGPGLVPYLKPGLRVVRGPDWKWGDQDGLNSSEGTVISTVSSDGWVPVRWDSGGKNAYRMGKDGKYDLQLAPSSRDFMDGSPDTEEENSKEMESEKTKLKNPNEVLKRASVGLLKLLSLCAGVYSDSVQESSVRKVSHYLRFNLQERNKKKQAIMDLNPKFQRDWVTLGFLRTIVRSKQICTALCAPSWLLLLFNIVSGQNVGYPVTISMQLQSLRLLQTILPTGLNDVNTYPIVIKKLFHLMGNIGLLCYPDLPLYNFVERKPIVSLTASSTSTIVEEFAILLRKLHTIPEWTEAFNSFMIAKLATAADLLSHPSLTMESDNEEISEILYGSIAALLVFGGLDSRPRLGGNVVDSSRRIGTICNIFSKSGTVMVQFHDTNKMEQLALKPLKPLQSNRFQLDKVPITDTFLDTWATLISVASLTHTNKTRYTSINISLLRNQQQILSVINAGRALLKYQSRLRKVLKRPTLEPHISLEALNEDDGVSDVRQSLLIHQLIINAVESPPLKPTFSRKELEEAAVNISQYLAVDVYAKQEGAATNLATNKHNIDVPARCPSPPVSPLVAQLMEMGFSRKAVEIALKATNEISDSTVNIEQLVAWLLEYSEECQLVADCLTSLENNNSDIIRAGTNTAVVPKCPITIYKKRTDFTNADEYAKYVRNNCAIGMSVRCCRSYEEEVYEGDTGVIVKINDGGLHDLNLQVDWHMKGYAYWVRFIHVELLGNLNSIPTIKVGDTVRVKPSVVTPQFKWGSITHSSVGIVTAVSKNGQQITVDFPQQANWIGSVSEMEVLPPHHQEIGCNYCFMKPIVGARFKCKICDNFNLCENCFYTPYDHQHNFVRIAEPGSAAIFAGKPRKVERHGIYTVLETDVIEDNFACVKYVTTSSRESWAGNLLDIYKDNYWQSCGTQGKHWIRLEMFPDICIHSLKMKVDPVDTSYMPSLVKVSGGNNFSSLAELAAVSIHPPDTVVTLLTDVQEYYPCIEIAVKMCYNGGIDCKVHAIIVTGKKRSCLDLPCTASFLASDYNDSQDLIETHGGIPQQNKVFAWGLNDKDQLGGLKGSKVKFPTACDNLSALRPVHIAGGSKSLFVVSYNGKVFACGETTNGRLGLGSNVGSSTNPRQISNLNNYIVRKVAVHSGGKHAMALTLSGKVFSWGEGDDGKLGHGTTVTLDKPRMIEYFKEKRIKDIACGSSYSAAITACGELYTWGLGEYGRLGHGDSVTQYKPKLVRALLGKHIVRVACGSRDAQTLALDNEGMVYSWGDGDFGKLGRGGSEACDLPCNIEYLNGKGVIHVDCGAQFSLALTKSGQVWTWGKGDYYRLGLSTDQHVRKPTLVSALKGIHIVDVAVGALHCLAVSSTGMVYSWGDNDHGQQGNGTTMVNQKPTAIKEFITARVNRVACGSSHSVAWQAYEPPSCRGAEPMPFKALNDPLGACMLGLSENKAEHFPEDDDEEDKDNNAAKFTPPSLSKQILSLESNVAKQTALQHVLNSLRVMYARDAVVAALSSSIKIENNAQEEKEELDEMIASSNVLSESSISTIAHGGGEAPAAAVESSDELASSSNMTTPDEVENPLNAFQSITSSGSASYHMSVSRISASTMSMVAATLKSNSQVLGVTDTDIVNPSILDDFTGLLGPNDARILVDLLKLAVAGRMADNAKETLTNVLKILASSDSCIAAIILEICVAELELVAINNNILNAQPSPVMQESAHPYASQIVTHGSVRIPGAESLRIEFDRRCSTEKNRDSLTLFDPFRMTVHVLSGREWNDWSVQLYIPGEEVHWKFLKDMKNNGWGWRFTVYPVMGKKRYGSDRDILSKPSIHVVMCLLHRCLTVEAHEGLIQRLVAGLASCAQLTTLKGKEKMWCLDRITEYLKTPLKKMLRMPSFSQVDILDSPLSSLMRTLPRLLIKQHEYEDHLLKLGKQLLYSPFFKSITALACELELDSLGFCGESGKWAWFKHYCIARRVADALIHRTTIPKAFCLEVRRVIEYDPSFTKEFSHDYENNELFTREHDEQLLMWLNRKPENWNLLWSGGGIIYGWGHNHRGQLGGVTGNQVKNPTPCEALSALRPVHLTGGEQSLFAITPEGRVYATGFADKGRLGIGDISHLNQGNPFISTPKLLEPLSKIFIKKVAVHSGGKHCLALGPNSCVFAWGDGEDGKLGLGHKRTCYSPTLIDYLRDKDIIDISCGGAHSAAIARCGKLYTWGRGRYGRLGHGDGDDCYIPKLVEALLGYQVTDVACGSGDAQTLCITSDDNVWSWGDGDYGKLGRGGADGCCIPLKIESLAGLGVMKVECGSQFSVALTRSGSVYTWGKGDYYRLGHGTDEHVRRPKKVAGLQGKKIVSIATGSLHVVVCTNKGEVYAWGDNDEGQIGDGTLKAVPRPRAIPALQDRNISLVVCGSAHTFAKSSDKPASRIHNMPAEVPLEYDLLKDLPLPLIRNRLVLLHYFSDLVAPVVNMFPLEGDISLDKLRGILVYSAKENIFRKVLNSTMAKEPHHGPTIELNRIQVKKSRVKGGYAGPDGMKTVFGQMVQKSCLTREALMLPHRVWKVQFVGESVDDYGGGYSESITEMCEELQNGSLPLLIPTPNGRDDTGTNRDCFILNPTVKSSLYLGMFNFLGVVMGIAIRTGSPLSLNLAEPVWKQLAGMPLTVADITEIDRDYIPGLLFIRDMNPDDKSFMDIPFFTTSASGSDISLSSVHRKVTPANRQEFIRLALNYRLHEFDEQVAAVRAGLAKVVPAPLLSLFTGYELETMVCGSPEIPLDLLKSVAVYKGVLPTDDLVEWFWEVMEEFTNQERSLFLRFVWGRTRLPRTIADFRGRDFVLQVMDKYNPPDHFLPESYTCFFLLKMPRYSDKFVLREKLKYAIYFCKSIDTDEYARIAIPGTGLTSSNSDSDGLESITGDDTTPT